MSRESSDPLPFIQVDRAVRAKAPVLASALGVTNQHAIGSLIEFWALNGDPRELEELIEQGKDAVELTGQQASLRFRIASGKEVEPMWVGCVFLVVVLAAVLGLGVLIGRCS